MTTGGRGEQVTTYGDWDNAKQCLVLSEAHAQAKLVCVTYTIGWRDALALAAGAATLLAVLASHL